MRAVVQREYGGADKLSVREVPAPMPGKGEVLVRVHGAALDRGTWHLMTGLPLVVRPFLGLRGPRTQVVGRDVAGVVEAVGLEVDDVSLGDEVIGTADGSCADLAVVPVRRLAAKPRGLTFEEAAALPVSGMTALRAVRDAGRVRPGQQVLVVGASGGVGSYAVQIARAYGAEVTAVCSGAKAETVRGLGAVRVVDYQREEPGAGGERYDVVIDIGGRRPLRVLRGLLTHTGTLVMVGGEGGGRWLGGLERQIGGALRSLFVRQRLVMLSAKERAEDMRALGDLVERGELRPVVDSTWKLEGVPDAIRRLEDGGVCGKLVVSV